MSLGVVPAISVPIDRPVATAVRHLTPNWFATVMGTGIVANCLGALHISSLMPVAQGIWILAAVLLVVLLGVLARQCATHRSAMRQTFAHPTMRHFWGALPMALLTVGMGAITVAQPIIGHGAAVAVASTLFVVGTIGGVATSVGVPYLMVTSAKGDAPVPAWLMSVVPPMVSATAAAVMASAIDSMPLRKMLVLSGYGLFGMSVMLGFMTLTMAYGQLTSRGLPSMDAAPTVWISLGVVGQSATAMNLLAAQGNTVFAYLPGMGQVMTGAAVLWGMVMGGFGVVMATLATALTVHAARRGMRFSMTWWALTFPIGTCVTGAITLGHTTVLPALVAVGGVMAVILVALWLAVSVGTVRTVTARLQR